MSKHTPGPWWAGGLEVGTVPMMDVKVAKVSGANYDEAKANARLIAAAPEMFDDLVLAAVTLRRYEALHHDKGTEDGFQKAEANRQLAERFEASLAKARGESV